MHALQWCSTTPSPPPPTPITTKLPLTPEQKIVLPAMRLNNGGWRVFWLVYAESVGRWVFQRAGDSYAVVRLLPPPCSLAPMTSRVSQCVPRRSNLLLCRLSGPPCVITTDPRTQGLFIMLAAFPPAWELPSHWSWELPSHWSAMSVTPVSPDVSEMRNADGFVECSTEASVWLSVDGNRKRQRPGWSLPYWMVSSSGGGGGCRLVFPQSTGWL